MKVQTQLRDSTTVEPDKKSHCTYVLLGRLSAGILLSHLEGQSVLEMTQQNSANVQLRRDMVSALAFGNSRSGSVYGRCNEAEGIVRPIFVGIQKSVLGCELDLVEVLSPCAAILGSSATSIPISCARQKLVGQIDPGLIHFIIATKLDNTSGNVL